MKYVFGLEEIQKPVPQRYLCRAPSLLTLVFQFINYLIMPSFHYIEQVSYGCHDGVTFYMRWNQARMVVNLDYNHCPDSMENPLIEKYTSACLGGDEEEVDAIEDEIIDVIVGFGAPTFDHFAPPRTKRPPSLQSILFPRQYYFSLATVGGRMSVLPEGSYRLEISGVPEKGTARVVPVPPSLPSKPRFSTISVRLEVKEDLRVPRYQTTDIQVLKNLLGDGYVAHVLVDGRDMCAKIGRDFDGGAMQRELDCLAKITEYSLQQPLPVNVPKLLGLIVTPIEGHVIGILEEFIPQAENQQLSALAMFEDVSPITNERKRAWFSKIQQTVDWLHHHGIIWGDARPDNVLIHPETDEAWLIDFGEGSVDESLASTPAGDDAGVERIREFLEIL